MGTTPDLGIPELAQSQANPDITHNEAMILFQALLNGVIDKDLTAPPGLPTDGDAYIVGAGATGAWTGWSDHIAISYGGSWRFIPGRDDAGTPIVMGARNEGLRVYVRDEGTFYIFAGSPIAWMLDASGGIADADYGDITVSGSGTVWTIDNDVVTNAKLRESGALSVIGRATNSTGNPADITAGANDRLLTRVANALAFTQLTDAMAPTNTLSLSKLVNASQRARIAATGSGAWTEIAEAADVSTMLGSADNAAIRSNIGVAYASAAEVRAMTANNRVLTPASLAERLYFKANKNGTSQTGVADLTFTKLTFTNELVDQGGDYDAVNSEWTPDAGHITIHAKCETAGTMDTGGQCFVAVYKNGSVLGRGAGGALTTANVGSGEVTITDIANGTDVYDIYVRADVTAGTIAVSGNVANSFVDGFQQ